MFILDLCSFNFTKKARGMAFVCFIKSIFTGFTGSCPSFCPLFRVKRVRFQRYWSISFYMEVISTLLLVHCIEVVPISQSPFREVPLYILLSLIHNLMFKIKKSLENFGSIFMKKTQDPYSISYGGVMMSHRGQKLQLLNGSHTLLQVFLELGGSILTGSPGVVAAHRHPER